MTTAFTYSTTYLLDKSHYIETYEASVPADNSKKVYLIAALLALVGLAVLMLTEINAFVAWFIIALGGLEVFSIRFKKPWWLARQLISKAANTELTLTIDEDAVSSKSIHIESIIRWADISKIESTENGWLLYHNDSKNYLSARALTEEAKAFVMAKTQLINPKAN
ncbi:YcxB family protein [Paraglaciecola sp. 20A4]|uniref:YcxB family protein n=1 Tax=Paraglaciecola sp. 20A4 TaxID=2687288 RepID=UPI00140863BE|nr:YcxB family protein [Paraglaciecola sp. 20A4]